MAIFQRTARTRLSIDKTAGTSDIREHHLLSIIIVADIRNDLLMQPKHTQACCTETMETDGTRSASNVCNC